MDYEKAFKEAYGRASLRFGTNVANELFLEYKESKEERTRRKLIEFFSDWSKTKSYCWGIRITDIMDWLEKQGEQKSAWSEEDEKAINDIMWIIEAYRENGFNETHKQMANNAEKWLKSLKQGYGWKPSKEQLYILNWLANVKLGDSVVEQEVSKHLNELYKDLKKL